MIVTSSSPDFHCKGLELKDNEMLYVPVTLLRSAGGSTCTLLCEGIMSKLILVQHSVLVSLFFIYLFGIFTEDCLIF